LKKLVYEVATDLKLLSPHPTLTGYDDFIGTYLFCGDKKVLVDVGPAAAIPGLLAALGQAEVKPDEIDYIILTHIHMDHAGGIGLAAKEMKNAHILAHSRAYRHLVDPAALWKSSRETLGELALKYGKIDPVPENRIIVVEDGMKLDIGKRLPLEIYLTPGHAPHHLCVLDGNNSVLLAGDLAGVYMDGFLRPASPPPFLFRDYMTSVDRMIALQPDLLGYAHFGCYDNAVERLNEVKVQTLRWYDIAQKGAKAGKTAEDIIGIIGAKDSAIDKINALNPKSYQRDYKLILNSIRGLMTAK
jgi:glyoxylase-like metal-dependent hydrolase (beta-lactamase superfamily II)